MKRILALMALTVNCADVNERPVGWQIDASGTPETSAPSTLPLDVPVPYEPTLLIPSGECEFPSLAHSGLPVATTGSEPALIESFNEEGCPAELWVHNYTGDQLSLTAYMPWDPPPAYIVHRPWVDIFEVADESKITERRDTHGGLLFWRQETRLDSAGEVLVRKVWGNNWSTSSQAEVDYHEQRFHPISLRKIWDEITRDGAVYWRTRTEVNAAGEPLRAYVFENDEERLTHEWLYVDGRLDSSRQVDGSAHLESTYVWHADSRHTQTTLNQTQGWLDVYDYDAQGRLTRHTQDENRDGQVEYLETNTYDELGRLILETNGYEFVNGVATTATEVTRTYDGDRLMLMTTTRTGRNASSSRVEYIYSGAGLAHETRELTRYSSGGVVREISQYDELGQEVMRTQDVGDDGSIERKFVGVFDGARPISSSIRSATQNVEQEWLYDEQDRLVLWVYDSDGDGTADQGVRYRYDVDGLAAYNALTPHVP